jgi:hypothetical protein
MLERSYCGIRQESQKCGEKIPKKFGGKKILGWKWEGKWLAPIVRSIGEEREGTGVRRFFPKLRISLSNLCM